MVKTIPQVGHCAEVTLGSIVISRRQPGQEIIRSCLGFAIAIAIAIFFFYFSLVLTLLFAARYLRNIYSADT